MHTLCSSLAVKSEKQDNTNMQHLFPPYRWKNNAIIGCTLLAIKVMYAFVMVCYVQHTVSVCHATGCKCTGSSSELKWANWMNEVDLNEVYLK